MLILGFRISVEEGDGKTEYRVWNPFRSKLAAAIVGGVDHIWIAPGSKVLYLGAASGTTVSHVSDIVGPVSGKTFFFGSRQLAVFSSFKLSLIFSVSRRLGSYMPWSSLYGLVGTC